MAKLSSEELKQIISQEGETRPISDNDLENIAFIIKQDPSLQKKVFSKLIENPQIKDALINEDKKDPVEKVKEKMKNTKFD